jgi:hypothetical protein
MNILQPVLFSSDRSPDIPHASDAYGWLVGSWNLDVLHYARAPLTGLTGEAHFGWVLEGRAIQDVWIMPARPHRAEYTDRVTNMYGTTLRVWDPSIDAWRITWRNAVSGHREEQIGRRVGPDVVQVGARADGTPTRWRFIDITPTSFHWIGEALAADGRTWILEGEFAATRSDR